MLTSERAGERIGVLGPGERRGAREGGQSYRRRKSPFHQQFSMEASGHARWFERLLAELNFELWIGDAAEIRTKRVRKQKTDRQDAQLILKLMLKDDFPRIWVPSWENRDLRQLLWHRHRMVQARTGIMNQLQAVALNAGTGTVSSVGSGQGLIGGPITTSGTLSLDTSFTDGRYGRLSVPNSWGASQTVTGSITATTVSGNNAASLVKGGSSSPGTVAALQVENLSTTGEAGFFANGNASNPFTVLKLLEVSGSNSGFLTCQRPDGTELCLIDKNGSFHAGSDFAEALPARGLRSLYEPGDVLVMAKNGDGVEKIGEGYSNRIVGIYSTRPAVLGADKNGVTRVDKSDVPVAITGIVPTKVSTENGPVRVGDLLVSSPTPGYAMRGTDHKRMLGAIVGKALQPMLQGAGVIHVLVMMR